MGGARDDTAGIDPGDTTSNVETVADNFCAGD